MKEVSVIVAGGYNNNFLRSVESYDVIADQWSPMPYLNKTKVNHRLAVVKNKLYVIGSADYGFEVYDKTCKKFLSLKPPLETFFYLRLIARGSKIIVFRHYRTSANCYDVETDEWNYEPCDVSKNMAEFSCVKVPWF